MLIECPECKGLVSQQADACPHCGHPVLPNRATPGAKKTKASKTWGTLVAIALVLGIIATVGEVRQKATLNVASALSPAEIPTRNVEPQRDPPDSFRGIKWDSVLPSRKELQQSVLKGCGKIVERSNFTDRPQCWHAHGDADDMDMFAQSRNVTPFLGVSVSEQLPSWSYKKFWSGEVFIHNYKDTDLAQLRAALISEYGSPTLDEYRWTEWNWRHANLKIILRFDPTAKPSIGGSQTNLQTSLSVRFTKTE